MVGKQDHIREPLYLQTYNSPHDRVIQTLENIIICSEKSKGSKKDLLLRLLGYITALKAEINDPYSEYLIFKREIKKKLMELNIKRYTSEFWKYKMKIVSNYPFWEKVLNDEALPFFNDLGDKLTEIFSSFRNDMIKQLRRMTIEGVEN